MSVQEAGKKGGISTRNKYGHTFFKNIGQRGGKVTLERHREKFGYWGKKGGRPRKRNLADMEETPDGKSKQKGGRGASFRLDAGFPPPK